MKKTAVMTAFLLGMSAALVADDAAIGSSPAATAAQASKLSEELIYSVDRTPEKPFDTPRAVEVITIEDIWRNSGMTIADVLTEVPGFYMQQTNYSGGAPIIRGLLGKQVLIMIDGIKLNNATWRRLSKEYLNIIDLAQVERIEVVRGVVSVLGTESLGGVINIITRKGPMNGESFAASVGTRYSSGDQGVSVPVLVHGRGANYRYSVGGTYHRAGDLSLGDGQGKAAQSAYNQSGAHGNLQYFVSSEKTLTFGFQTLEQRDVMRPEAVAEGRNISFGSSPIRFHLGSVSYQDLTSRPWTDSMTLTGYFHRQSDVRDEVRKVSPTVRNYFNDVDDLFGGSLEFSKFVASHHLVYGVDFSRDRISSTRDDYSVATGEYIRSGRGRYTDGATYQTAGIYLNDTFDITRWVTVTAGARYGRFQSAGEENTDYGVLSVDASNGDFTGAVNVVVHAAKNFNIVGNVIRGFRAPNLDEISRFSERSTSVEIPNPNIGPERVMSYELGFKYDTARFGATGMVYRNELSGLLFRGPGTYQGKNYFDQNGNNQRDPGEKSVSVPENTGEALIRGIELGLNFSPMQSLVVFGNYNRALADDVTTSLPLELTPPRFGTAGLRWLGATARRPWAEFVYEYAGDQTRLSETDIADFRIGPNGTPGYDVFHLRGGFDLTNAFRFSVGVENLTDAAYKTHGSFAQRPGRQLVLATEYRF